MDDERPSEDEIMTLQEVAAYLKLAERTVYLYAQRGQLPGIKIGSAWRFRRTDLDAWLDEQRRLTEVGTNDRRRKSENKGGGA